MSDRATPSAAEALALVREALSSDDSGHVAGTFIRGLTLGALIGAAIAGSAVWQRRERRRHQAALVATTVHEHP